MKILATKRQLASLLSADKRSKRIKSLTADYAMIAGLQLVLLYDVANILASRKATRPQI
jgi:hypothetical protein